jgi:hypothetical protein
METNSRKYTPSGLKYEKKFKLTKLLTKNIS